MLYNKTIQLKNGRTLTLRNGTAQDGEFVLYVFNKTHEETDNLLTYPDEQTFDAEREGQFLQKLADSEREIEILAVLDGVVIGTAGIEQVGGVYKLRHRAEFGISVLKEYWGCGAGRALTRACIECARQAGYTQLELSVVGDNERAVALYESEGFRVFGRNPRGFRSRESGYQELISMRLEL